MKLYCLFEHSTGYALLKIDEVEEIGSLLETVTESMHDYAKFAGHVKLAAFSAFSSGVNALENINAVSEGSVHDDLKSFLENNLPSKLSKVTLGVQDPKLAQSLGENFEGLTMKTGEAFIEVCRVTRLYFGKMQKGLSDDVQMTAQRGLAHSYSRSKLRFNIHRQDNMIIQAIALIDQLDKNINTFAMRVREWYSYHFPELVRIVNDNYPYCRLVKLIGRRENLLAAVQEHEANDDDEAEQPELIKKIEEILMDSTKTQAICDASRRSLGMGISDIDLQNVDTFADQVVQLGDYRKELQEYLRSKMDSVAPNLAALIGDIVGARLISHAGSITNLAKYPASTIQILGAEKALFRALKKKGNTPKYGLIFHSTFIGRAGTKNKGRISRYLANKAAIASRIDCFSDEPNNVVGTMLKQQVEDRLSFFETGEVPKKNIDVMKEACAKIEANSAEPEESGEKKKKRKKKKKSKAASDNEDEEVSPAKKAKVEDESDEVPEETPKKKKKKKKSAQPEETVEEPETPEPEKKKKKKKKKKAAEEEMSE